MAAARALTPDRVLEPARIEIAGGRIAAVDSGEPHAHAPDGSGTTIDLGDHLVVPGFVDVHVHGGGGAQASGEDPVAVAREVRVMAEFHVQHGTTALVPTTVAESPRRLLAAVQGIAQACAPGTPAGPRSPGAATILGSHLEGPWIAPGRAGAHDPAQLRSPDRDELAALIAAADGSIRLITLAPELPGALELIRSAVSAGITVSVGHTDATDADVHRAVDAGARHATHLFNAMPELQHRAPGPVGALLADERVTVEIIADGHHLHRDILAVVGAAARGRVAAVTDAVAATGLADGAHRLGAQAVQVTAGRVTLAGRTTLAGSVLTMDHAVRTLVAAGWSLTDAVTAGTRTPADSVFAAAKGRLEVGADADLVVLDRDLRVAAVLAGGIVAHDPGHLFAPIEA